jgi:signal transduction histidine kinase
MELVRKLIKLNRLEEAERFIDNAIASTKRVATLTDRIQAFSNRASMELKPAQLNDVIGAMESLLRNSVAPSIDVRVVLSQMLWMTLCDSAQFEKILLHLVSNANDAMPTGGTLLIETSNESVCDILSASRPDMTPGQYVCIAVTDSGIGMDRETIQTAFDPLFTTKASGLNAGFGLSSVYRFVRQSRGDVEISSEVDRGTTVKLYLPRYDAGQPALLKSSNGEMG